MNGYDAFYQTYLDESPSKVNGESAYTYQLNALRINNHIGNISAISASSFKLTTGDQVTYWLGAIDASVVDIIVDTETYEKYRKVVLSSKNPNIAQGTSPFASELYLVIAADVNAESKHMVFTSDSVISNDAERLWLGLLARGNKVSVFDSTSSKYELIPIETEQEMLSYVGQDKKQYLFVLSENNECRAGAIHSVHLMEIKRLCNWPLNEVFEKRKKLL